MADIIIANDPNSEKSNLNELIYLGSLICDTITEVEPKLNLFLSHDPRISFLLSMKDKWVGRFWELQNNKRVGR